MFSFKIHGVLMTGLYGQLGIGVNTKMSTPKIVKTLINEPIYFIACGAFETVIPCRYILCLFVKLIILKLKLNLIKRCKLFLLYFLRN